MTFPKSVGQIPFNFPHKPSSQIDGGKNPGTKGDMSRVNGALYPFGYGLSYTTFEYSDINISPKVITPNQKVQVRCKVTNTGKRAGDEVVQLYVRDLLSRSQHTKRISKASNAFIYNRVKQKRYPLPSTGKHWNF